MRIQIIGILLLAATSAVGTDATPSVRFAVANVKIATNRYPMASADLVIKRAVGQAEASACGRDRLVAADAGDMNPFIRVAYLAFAQHKGLVLSPDMIWLLIAQGFAEHVDRNADALHDKLVTHKGKIALDVRRDDFVKGSAENPWNEVLPEFSRQIGQHTKQDLYGWLVPRFSTTRDIEQAAFEVTLMDAMGKYFAYDFWTLCGIPFVRLEGTTQDWEAILDRVRIMRNYGMAKWVDELEPILQQFVNASKGNVDKEFWNSIFSEGGGSGEVPHVTGWAIKFFPHSPHHTIDGAQSINIDEFPKGTRKVDFTWHYYDKKYAMEFVAGFVGVYHDELENSVRPVIGWAVREAKYNRDNLILGNPLDRAFLGLFATSGLLGCLFWAWGRHRDGEKLSISCRIAVAAIPFAVLVSCWCYVLIRSGMESMALGYGSGRELNRLFAVTAIGLIVAQGVITPVGAVAAIVSFVRRSSPLRFSVGGFLGNAGLLALWWILFKSGFAAKMLLQ